MKYRPEVDGLRAVAVLPVLFFHAGFTLFSGGFVGVDVFFVISGYLITNIIVADLSAGRFSVWSFYLRRLRRIAPALLVMCAATIPFAWVWMLPSEFNDYSKSLYTTALSVSNFHFWQKADYFAAQAELMPLLHTWSLGVEEQFYIVFPLLLILFGRFRLPAVALLAISSFLLALVLGPIAPAANFYLLPTRFWELAIGSVVAMSAIQPRGRAMAELCATGGLVLIVLSVLLLDGDGHYPGWYTLPSVLGTAMFLAVGDPRTFAARLLSWSPLVAVGLISYSVYLWHQPLFAFARIRLMGDVSDAIYLSLIALTFAFAYASWRWVEQPCRNRVVVDTRKIVIGIGAACALTIAIGLIGDLTNGLGQTRGATAQAAGISERMRINFGLSADCEGKLPVPDTCTTSGEPEILVWGDSFAMHLVPGIVASNPAAGIAQFTKSACGPFFGIAPIPAGYPRDWPERCLRFTEAVKSYVRSTKSLRFAVLGSPFHAYLDGDTQLLASGERVLGGPELARAHFKDTLDLLRANGLTPVVFMPPPVDGREIGTCLARSVWLGISSERCNLSPEARHKRAKVMELLDGLGVAVIDIAEVLCDERACSARTGDVLVFRDGAHLSYEGSAYLGRQMSFYDRIVAAEAID
ncbi:acyltransferase family protein [Mesorhizobium sp. ZMM04-5]|uniref:Acyltransferase family protein n=2 Tax=Mesorhizobium marinum TaxID=3228790 RepID=A0ABV3R386_9HYPH